MTFFALQTYNFFETSKYFAKKIPASLDAGTLNQIYEKEKPLSYTSILLSLLLSSAKFIIIFQDKLCGNVYRSAVCLL